MSDVKISNLRGCDFSSLYESYTAAFSDYFVPYHISEDQFRVGLRQVAYDPSLSFGAFESNGRMVGFWLTAFDAPSDDSKAYGVGTGVIPEERRSGIATKLFAALEREIIARNIGCYSLGVDEENEPAVEFYAGCGFVRSGVHYSYCARTLLPPVDGATENFALREISLKELSAVYLDFLEYQPGWQNTLEAMKRIGDSARAFAIERGGSLLGYGIFQPARCRISQLGISEVGDAVLAARTLFQGFGECMEGTDPLHITSVPDTAQRTIGVLQEAGFIQAGFQYEMAKRYSF